MAQLFTLTTIAVALVCFLLTSCKCDDTEFDRLASAQRDKERTCQEALLASRVTTAWQRARNGAALQGSSDSECPGQFDGFACWQGTAAADTWVTLPCPDDIFLVDSTTSVIPVAKRQCLGGGRWRRLAHLNGSTGGYDRTQSWTSHQLTDYTECRPKDPQMVSRLYRLMSRTNVSNETQQLRVTVEQLMCQRMNLSDASEPADTVRGCGQVFDGALCWPPGSPGTLARLPCPDYLNEIRRDRLATRRCLDNGSWYSQGDIGIGGGWTNFTDCLIHGELAEDEDSRIIKMHLAIMNKIGIIGHSLSLLTLLIAITILSAFRRLHCRRNYIHTNLYVAFSLRAASHFVNYIVPKESETFLCRFNQSLMTFTVVSSFTWVFVEALHLYMLIFVSTMTNDMLSTLGYIAIGWGLSCLITTVWIVLRVAFDNETCWREYRPLGPDIWLLNTYLCLLVATNAVLFVKIVRELFIKLRRQPINNEASQAYRKLWKSTCVLVLVFGIYYIIFLPVDMIPKDRLGRTLDLVHLYYEHFFNSFQGFIASMLFCFVNSDVHTELRRLASKSRLTRWLRANSGLLAGGPNGMNHNNNASDATSYRKMRRGGNSVRMQQQRQLEQQRRATQLETEEGEGEQIPLKCNSETDDGIGYADAPVAAVAMVTSGSTTTHSRATKRL